MLIASRTCRCVCVIHTSVADAVLFFFLMIRRPPRSTLDRSSAASDVYKRQDLALTRPVWRGGAFRLLRTGCAARHREPRRSVDAVSYTHLRAHETVLELVCRLLLEKKTN